MFPCEGVELQNNSNKVDAGNSTGNENRRSKSASGVHLKRTSSRTSTGSLFLLCYSVMLAFHLG